MMRYIRVYLTLMRLNLSSLIVYPANFYNSLIATVAWSFFSLYSIVLLTTGVRVVFGMTRGEILLLNGVYGMIIAIFHVLFSYNFARFSSVIHKGELDSVLLKPIDSQFLLSFWLFGWVSISRILISVVYVAVLIDQLGITVGFTDYIVFFVLGGCAILLLYSLWYMVITLTIWFTRTSNLVELMFNITGVARYPKAMFAQSAQIVPLFLFPILLMINTPARVYLHRVSTFDAAMLIILAGTFFVISRKFWRFALRFYTSASS